MKIIINENHYKYLFNEENLRLEANNNLSQLPKQLFDNLKSMFSKIEGNKKYTTLDGYKRLQNIINANGLLSYDWLRRIKNFFDNYKGGKDIIYQLNGGDELKVFVNDKLDELINKSDSSNKIAKQIGVNTFYKGISSNKIKKNNFN